MWYPAPLLEILPRKQSRRYLLSELGKTFPNYARSVGLIEAEPSPISVIQLSPTYLPPANPYSGYGMAPRRDRGGAGAGAGPSTGGTGRPDAPDAAPDTALLGRTPSQSTVPLALSTPKQSQATPYVDGSGSLTRRITRSMTYADQVAAVNSAAGSSTRLEERLRSSASSAGGRASRRSNLEDAPSIRYETGDQRNVVRDESSRTVMVSLRPTRPPPVTQQYFLDMGRSTTNRPINSPPTTRASARLKAMKGSTRDSTPSDAVSNDDGEADRPRKKRKLNLKPRKMPLRRSARLAKPLTTFHKYPDLPVELQMMIWEAAIEPRLVYFRNRFTHPQTLFPKVQNQMPTWFMTCKLSHKIAMQNYRSMFPIRNESSLVIRQPMNFEMDIVLLEPCCNGCRARNCAARTFASEDREAVRRIAVQTESPFLMPSAPPCWSSISEIWPNVDTIYLINTAIRGDDRREKAMVRVEDGPHEKALRKRFDHWKKEEGSTSTVQALEFVSVVEKENNIQREKRYKSVVSRKTNLSEDIIIG